MAALSLDDLFIPLPTPEAGGTPILKWVLSRPNTHLYPLHLLTTGRGSLAFVQEEIVVGYDEESPYFNGDDDGFESSSNDAGVDGKSTDDVIDESDDYRCAAMEGGGGGEVGQSLNEDVVQPPNDLAFLQNPHDATSSSMMTTMEPMDGSEMIAPLPPIHSFFSLLPPLPPPSQPLQHPSELLQALLMQQQHATTLMMMQQLQQTGGGGLQPMQPSQQRDVIVGAERDRIWRPYEIVLPPSPVYEAKTDDVIKTEDEVKIEDDVIKTEDEDNIEDDVIKTEDDVKEEEESEEIIVDSPKARSSPIVPLSPGAKAAVAALRSRLPTAVMKESQLQRRPRHELTKQQRNAFRGIFARVRYLQLEEQEELAVAFGITPRQVRNLFANRGGRATHRKTTPMSTEEALGIIREELHKFGIGLNDDEDVVRR